MYLTTGLAFPTTHHVAIGSRSGLFRRRLLILLGSRWRGRWIRGRPCCVVVTVVSVSVSVVVVVGADAHPVVTVVAVAAVCPPWSLRGGVRDGMRLLRRDGVRGCLGGDGCRIHWLLVDILRRRM